MFTQKVFNIDFDFETALDLFSPKKIDEGTKFLLENCEHPKQSKLVLDLGCGYGTLGIVFAKLNPKAQVVMVDDNPEALKLAKENASANGLGNVRILPFSVIEKSFGGSFSTVLSNPPWHKNKTVTPHFVALAHTLLNPGGKFYVVINKIFRTQDLMTKTFGNCEETSRNETYKVLLSKKIS